MSNLTFKERIIVAAISIVVVLCITLGLYLMYSVGRVEPELPLPIPIIETWGEFPGDLSTYNVQWCKQTGYIRIVKKEE